MAGNFMTLEYVESQDSKLATVFLYEWFKKHNSARVDTITVDSIAPEDLIFHDLGSLIIFIGLELTDQWINVFKALTDRSINVCIINNLGQAKYTDRLNDLKVEYHMSDSHSITYNVCKMIDEDFIHSDLEWLPEMVKCLEPDSEHNQAFLSSFNMRNIDVNTFFYDLIPKNDYDIFNPGKFETQRMNGFASHCVSDGEVILRYKNWLIKQPNKDKGTAYTIKDANSSISVLAINSQHILQYTEQYADKYDIIYNYYFNGDKWTYSFISTTKSESVLKDYAEFIANDKCIFGKSKWIILFSNEIPLSIKNGCTVEIKSYKKHKYVINYT